MSEKKSGINPLFIIAVVVLVGIIVGAVVFSGKKTVKPAAPAETTEQEAEVAPTIEDSTKVELTSETGKKEVMLSISGIPSGTESIEYELSYQEETKGLQGVIGTIAIEGGAKTYSKQITLGTCSSGRCVYHVVVGSVKATLKFTGSYGDKLFEKEYDI